MDGVRIERIDPASADAQQLLTRFADEIVSLFPGFELAGGVPTSDDDFRPPRGAFLAAYLDRAPVGCGSLRRLDAATAEVKRMWVDPAVRGRGVGRRLLTALEAGAAGLGCRVVRLDTHGQLAVAVAMYRSSGYTEIPAYNDNGYAALWMEKALPARS